MRTIVLELESKTAEKLHQMARAQNLSLESLLAIYVPGLQPTVGIKSGQEEQDKVQAFEQWVADFPKNLSPLSDQAISRSSIYPDR